MQHPLGTHLCNGLALQTQTLCFLLKVKNKKKMPFLQKAPQGAR